MKDKVAATNHPRESRGTNLHSRHIPAEVKRAVWQRDGGRCAFVSRSGRRCTEDGFLEFHHVLPYAVGGEATVRNIELRCRAHNGYEAERALGRGTASVVRETAAAYVTSIIRVSPGELPNTTSPEVIWNPTGRSSAARREANGQEASFKRTNRKGILPP